MNPEFYELKPGEAVESFHESLGNATLSRSLITRWWMKYSHIELMLTVEDGTSINELFDMMSMMNAKGDRDVSLEELLRSGILWSYNIIWKPEWEEQEPHEAGPVYYYPRP